MAKYNQRLIIGAWKRGYALDLHTVSSVFLGYDEYGHAKFDNTHSEVGELLYKLKYSQDRAVVEELASVCVHFLRKWKPDIDIIVPVPPSHKRKVQPVLVLATAIAEMLEIDLRDCVTRRRNIPQLKNVSDLDERTKLLTGAHAVNASVTKGKKILLLDDLFRSGATMNAITTELYEKGNAAIVYALTVTRTRSNA